MSRLQRFHRAMESVYGDLAGVADPTTWTPPPAPAGHRGRYLWTDAFGVVNFLTLHKESLSHTGNQPSNGRYLIFAQRLIETVHDILGHTRDGQARLPGATDQEPLKGGLRIGKVAEAGSEGDGQYHHYLTVWMFALNRMTMATGDPTYNKQAVSLAKAIHPHFFIDRASPRPRMVWKVATDLSRPLVSTAGNLDPIEGFVTFSLLQATAAEYGDDNLLEEEIHDYQRAVSAKGHHKLTSDTLDLGMTLWVAHWYAGSEEWATVLANRCIAELQKTLDHFFFNIPPNMRLAFREFGTCLGISCLPIREEDSDATSDLVSRAERIISQWEQYMSSSTPEDLRPITMVMYATALIPGAFKFGYFGPEPLAEEGNY